MSLQYNAAGTVHPSTLLVRGAWLALLTLASSRGGDVGDGRAADVMKLRRQTGQRSSDPFRLAGILLFPISVVRDNSVAQGS